jgi:hypothetical protein
MSYASVDTQPNLLKKLFANKLEEIVYSRSELLKRAKKNTKVGGEDFSFSIRVTPTAGTSNDFTEAQAAQAESKIVKFAVPFRRQFTVMTIEDELIARTRAGGNTAAFDEAVKVEARAAVESSGEKLSRDAWRDGGGSMGVIDSTTTTSSTTLKLANRSDIRGFHSGQHLHFSNDNGTSSPGDGLRSATAVEIVSVNRALGTMVLSATMDSVSAATGDFIYLRGGYQKGWFGNRGWVPDADPSASEDWCGVDRTDVDILRTSGVRVDGDGNQMVETLFDAGAEASINGIDTPQLFAHPRDLVRLRKQLQGQVTYSGDSQKVGGKMSIALESGNCEIISEPWLVEGIAHLGDASLFEIGSAGEVPTPWADENGKLFRTKDTAAAREGRLACFGNFRNNNPGKWVSISW